MSIDSTSLLVQQRPHLLHKAWLSDVAHIKAGKPFTGFNSPVEPLQSKPLVHSRTSMHRLIEGAGDSLVHNTIKPTVIVFHSLNIFALILVSVVLITATTARRIRRIRTWYTYLWTLLLFIISFLLHPFKSSDFQPNFVPCLIQAVLVYVAPPASSWALLALVVEVYMLTQARSAILGTHSRFMLLCAPINIFVWGVTLVVIEGLRHPSSVGMQADLLYCHLSIPTPAIIGTVVYLIPIAVCIPLFVSIVFKAYRNSRLLERDRAVSIIPLASVLRIGVLLFAPILGLGIAFSNNVLENLNRLLPLGLYALLTPVPILTAIAFGSQRDMVSAASSLWGRVLTR
ncbi:hypothetical protein BDN72DRAFT_900832 [Pluteus cervinus]|uniref:Uncharacterized protein n=1 Tax=Pluteus cervinus TaxID=181527 RepID=A0ACD3AHP3_9AGAR|nr:hypothetical protein BDN72DRAFT_900832 [Pluteus cervinus]